MHAGETALDKTPLVEYRAGMEPEITISNRQRRLAVSESSLRRLVEFVSAWERRDFESVDVAIVEAEEIESLNLRYLDHPGPTDVLSFDLSEADSPGLSAQIVVCSEMAMAEAPRHGLSPDEELMLYVIHGLLHLVGYDDAEAGQAERMTARQEELLAKFVPMG